MKQTYIAAGVLLFFLLIRKKANPVSVNTTGKPTFKDMDNVSEVNEQLKKYKFSRNIRIAILAVVGKESNFRPRFEDSYKNTSVFRIRKIYGLSELTDQQIENLKQNDENFFNYVYSNKRKPTLGNTQPGDGYKFRGSGFNGLTGRAAYRKYGKLVGVDLENNPALNNKVNVAGLTLGAYFYDRFTSEAGKKKAQALGGMYNDLPLNKAILLSANANAGLGYALNDEVVTRAYDNAKKFSLKIENEV